MDQTKALTQPEIDRIKEWARETLADQNAFVTDMRNAVIVLVLLGTAARRFELCALRCGDVKNDGSGPTVHFEEAKGNAPAPVPISDELWLTIQVWLSVKVDMGEGTGDDAPLFCGARGEHMSVATLHNAIKGVLRAANVSDHYSVHAFRHGAAFAFLRAGGTVVELQRFLRHSNLQTTSVYAHVDAKNVREGIKKSGL